ncbi:hypothetical protein ACLQ2R_30420 [Streptosporangium sp. DT93]|uniref:hypothetical protein n=1 Tax=Streptosporangium sp. DT93 TaxID=3393428 RepID=UPI003CEAB73B
MADPSTGAVAVVPVVVDPVPAGLFKARLMPPPLRPDQVYGGWVLVAAGADVLEVPHEIGTTDTTDDRGDASGSARTGIADGVGDAGDVDETAGEMAGMGHPDAFVPVRIRPGSPEAHRKTRKETSGSYAMPIDPWLKRVVPVTAPQVMRTVPVPPWRGRA